MYSTKYQNIDCNDTDIGSYFKSETDTHKTVGSTNCEIDDNDPPAEQTVDFDAHSNNNNAVYAHAKAESEQGKITIQSDEWVKNVYLPSGTAKTKKFEIQASGSSLNSTDTLTIDIYHSSSPINTDDPDSDIPNAATDGADLEPELTLS